MIVCPICEKNDQLMKVVSIVDQGTHNISGQTDSWVSSEHGGHWESVPISATQRSELARKLALLSQPTQPAITFGTIALGTCVYFFLIPVTALLALLVAGFLCKNCSPEVSGVFAIILGGAILLAPLIIYLIWYGSGRAKYSVDKPKWDKAWRIWNRLYFCFRDNKIYDPETGKTFEVSYLNQYCFAQ